MAKEEKKTKQETPNDKISEHFSKLGKKSWAKRKKRILDK